MPKHRTLPNDKCFRPIFDDLLLLNRDRLPVWAIQDAENRYSDVLRQRDGLDGLTTWLVQSIRYVPVPGCCAHSSNRESVFSFQPLRNRKRNPEGRQIHKGHDNPKKVSNVIMSV